MIGSTLSQRYEITAEIGRGGMGVVYRARDPVLNREVAVKLIPPSLLTAEAEQRFQREAQLVAQMDHPAIVPIHDYGRHEGSLFFVMPIVQGTNLRALLRERSLLAGQIVDIGIQAAEALDYSHRHGVVHRDIKPENIMVEREGGGGVRVRIMDFGLARGATENRLTKSGTLVGTLGYLSPEQVGSKDIDGRSDIYSLGTVLYECVVGEPPFLGELQSILYRILHELPQAPRSRGVALDPELESLILSCLAKEPGQRPQSAGELAEGLRRYRSRMRESDRNLSLMLTGSVPVHAHSPSPFIGRGQEIAELQQRLNAAVAGECQLVVVAGDAGIGKTRLLDELEALARARKIRVLHGRSIEQNRSFPYQGFCEAIQDFFRLKETGSSPSGVPDLADLGAGLVNLFPVLNEIGPIRAAAQSGAPPGRSGEPRTQGAENRTEIFELLARTLARLAAGKPLLLLLEDLQGAELSIEALQYIVRRLAPTPTLIVATYRPTEIDKRHPLTLMLESFRGDRRFAHVSLQPFTPAEHRLFLQTLVGGAEVAGPLAERLYEGSEGNPFFTKELVRSLLDSGGIARDGTGAFNLSRAGPATEALPATIQQAVERRIERLPADQKEILATASVIGKSFDARELEALLGDKSDPDEALDRLVLEGLIEEERESRGDRLSFVSGVVRDVLYAGLTRRRRRALHQRYAEQLEARHGGRLDRYTPQLVYHFSQADAPEKTVTYALRLAKTSLDAFSPEEAARAARVALEFLDEEWDGDRTLEGEARKLLALAHGMTGDIEGALKESEAAVTVFERAKDPQRAAAVLLMAAETAWHARRTEETARLTARGMEAARAAGDPGTLHKLLSLAATLATLRGDYESAGVLEVEAGLLLPGVAGAAKEEDIPPGGRLVVALASSPRATEPAAIEIVEEAEILANVFETLLATDPAGNLVPALCERWEARDEGRTILLTLRPGISFSDGHGLGAEDVKTSFERSLRELTTELPTAFVAIQGAAEFRAGAAGGVAGLTARAPDLLEIRLTEPLPIYPALLTDPRAAVTRGASASAAALLGTGPFRIASRSASRVVLDRNPSYWKEPLARLDAIEFRPDLSAATIAESLRSGDLDVAKDLLPQDLEELRRDPRFRGGLVEAPQKNTYFVLLNAASGPLARNRELRRFLLGTIRTRDLVWQALGRSAQPAASLIPPGMLGHDPGRRRRALTREEALATLEASGLPRPIHLTASAHPLFTERYRPLLDALLAVWREFDVHVAVAVTSMESYLDSFQRSEGLDLLIGRWIPDFDDPDTFTHNLFNSGTGLLRGYFTSAEADALLLQARAEVRPGAREDLYWTFESLLQESAALAPLFHDIGYRIAGPKVRGLRLQSTPPYVNFASLGKVETAVGVLEKRSPGGIFHVAIAGLVRTLDPALSGTIEESDVFPNIFETLTRGVGGSKIVPWLAAEVRSEEGGRRYRFRLRDDVRFHDGRRLTARDVRYSLERLLQSADSGARGLFSAIRGAKSLLNGEAGDLVGLRILSASELTIELEEPVSFFPALLSYDAAAILPEGGDASGGNAQTGCVGTGPFRVVRFEPGRRLELERNKDYWRTGYPKSESLIFSFGVEPREILSDFRSGRFSIAGDLFPEDAETLRRDPEFASGYVETPRLSTHFLAFNINRGPLRDLALRQALARAVDVPALVRRTLGRLATPAHGLIPPGLLGHDAAPHLRAAGPVPGRLPSSLELTAALNPTYFRGHSAVADALTAAFREIGVSFSVVNTTFADYSEAMLKGTVDVVFDRWIADFPDSDSFVHEFHTREGTDGRMCGTPELDSLIERGRAEPAPALRHSIYREIEERIARETLILPLFHEQVYRFARPEVEGLSLSVAGSAVDYASLRARD